MSKTVFVYDGWSSPYPILIGRLFIDSEKKEETYSFEYDKNWLTRTLSSSIDPDLSLYSGRQFPLNKKMFGIFSDSLYSAEKLSGQEKKAQNRKSLKNPITFWVFMTNREWAG